MSTITLRLLLALVVTFASVVSVAHIHIETHFESHSDDDEHLEQCLYLHQFQLIEATALPSIAIQPIGRTEYQLRLFQLDSAEQSRRPQVRAPPIAS